MIGLLVALVLAVPPPSTGSALVFHGWSPDSRLVAYTRHRGAKGKADERVHRFVKDGDWAGFGRKVGLDVEAYAKKQGYVATPCPRRELERSEAKTVWEVRCGKVVMNLGVDVGTAVSWQLVRSGVVLAAHTFDRIYLGVEPELYPAPNGTQAVLVMHLDTGWETDAAIFPVTFGN